MRNIWNRFVFFLFSTIRKTGANLRYDSLICVNWATDDQEYWSYILLSLISDRVDHILWEWTNQPTARTSFVHIIFNIQIIAHLSVTPRRNSIWTRDDKNNSYMTFPHQPYPHHVRIFLPDAPDFYDTLKQVLILLLVFFWW